MTPGDTIRDFFLKGGIPVTLTILALNVLTFLSAFLSPQIALPFIATQLMFDTSNAVHAPWTFLTYPIVAGPFNIMLIVTWVFFWLSGGSLERSWGSARFAAFFFALTAVSAASLFLGGMLLHQLVPPLNDLFLPLTGLIVAFCMLNPTQTIALFFFPIQARWLALIFTGYTYFTYGTLLGPKMGLFACGGILAATLYVRFGRSWADVGSYSPSRRPAPRGPDLRIYPAAKRRSALDGSTRRSPFDFAGRWKDWQEKRRLEKLLRNSGFSDTEPRWRDDEEHRKR